MTFSRTGPGVATLRAAVAGLDGLEGKTGWFETNHYPEGLPVAYVATIHEFGTNHIPARPFMRPAVADHGGEWIDKLAAGAKDALNGHATPHQVMELVALQAAGNVAEKIAAVTSPTLSPITIKRKGHDTPLLDRGIMGNSVTGKVERS